MTPDRPDEAKPTVHRRRPELHLTENERGWVEFIRLVSRDSDPAPTLRCVQGLRALLRETGAEKPRPAPRS